MPIVTATPRGLLNGKIVTEFTDTTSASSVTYTYPVQQAGIKIENSGIADIFVTVGTYVNQVINPDKTWKADAAFTSFSIRSDVNSQEFIATAFQNDVDGSGEADSVAIPPAPLLNASVLDNYTGTLPIAANGAWVYGVNNVTLQRSSDFGATWENVTPLPGGGVWSMLWCVDGEVIIQSPTYIWKSTGWHNSPSTATWSIKITKSSSTGPGMLPWGIDGDGQKFIATEYSGADRSESRYIWISIDMGNTWNIALDKLTIDPDNTSHIHGVCYDKWADRFFVSHGHGVLRRIYYSDDDGTTWVPLGGSFRPDAAPTVLFATDNGIVCGSDSVDAGLYGIARTENPADMELRRTARWNVTKDGVTGFACKPFRDPATGYVYVTFKTDLEGVNYVVMAGTAVAGSTVWESPAAVKTDGFHYNVISKDNFLGVSKNVDGTYQLIKGKLSDPSSFTFDKGNVDGGQSFNSTSIAIGPAATTSKPYEVVIGPGAKTTGNYEGIAIGYNAQADTAGTAIGRDSIATDDQSIAIGRSASADGINIVVVGSTASTFPSSTHAVAVGYGAKATATGTAVGGKASAGSVSGITDATSVGYNARASNRSVAIGKDSIAGSDQVAIGSGATAAHSNAVALGKGTATTATDQVNLGARHIEITELAADPAAPALNGARLFTRDNGAGKTQVCVRFNTGAVVVIATEP